MSTVFDSSKVKHLNQEQLKTVKAYFIDECEKAQITTNWKAFDNQITNMRWISDDVVSKAKSDVDLLVTKSKNIVKPYAIVISPNIEIVPKIVSKNPLVWRLQVYNSQKLKLTKEVAHYWWNKTHLSSEIAEILEPEASSRDLKIFKSKLIAKFAEFGQTVEVLKPNMLFSNFSDFKEVPSEVRNINLDEIYENVGYKVRAKGRVTTILKGVKEYGDNYNKQILLFIDNVEGQTANIPISYMPSSGESDPDGIVEIEGIVEAQPTKGKNKYLPMMCLIKASKITKDQMLVDKYTPSPEDQLDFKKYFGQINNGNAFEIIDKTVAPYIYGRALEKVCGILAWLASLEVPICGWKNFQITVLFYGDPRTGKDYIAEDIATHLSPVTIIVNAEMAKQTGLIGACVKDPITGSWVICWGRLVQADRLGAVLQGISGFDQYIIPQLREILAQRMASMTKVVQGKRQCRARLILTGNCTEDLKAYKNGLQAGRDTGSRFNKLFVENPDWLRIHVPVPFSEEDVPTSEIDNQITKKNVCREIPEDIFKKKVADTWKRTNSDYLIEEHVIEACKAVLSDFREDFKSIQLAILKPEGLYIFLSQVIGFATLRHAVDEHNRIKPELSDVEFVKALWNKLFEKLGLENEKVQIEQEAVAVKIVASILLDPETPNRASLVATPNEENYLRQTAKIVEILFDKKYMTKEKIGELLEVSDVTVWNNLSKAQQFLARIPDVEPLTKSSSNVGLWLTSFGRKVAKAMDVQQHA